MLPAIAGFDLIFECDAYALYLEYFEIHLGPRVVIFSVKLGRHCTQGCLLQFVGSSQGGHQFFFAEPLIC